MKKQDLRDLQVDDALIGRLVALFGDNIPKPPSQMMTETGQYQCLNEFYAMKLVIGMGERLNVRNVKKHVTGTMANIARNYKILKETIPEAFALKAKDKTDDVMGQLKRELVAQERAVFEIELEELDAKHTADLIQLEANHASAVRALEDELIKAKKENAVKSELLMTAQASNEELHEKLKHEAININELKHVQLLAMERKESLDESKKVIEVLKAQFEHFKQKTDERIVILEQDKRRAQTSEQVTQRHLEDSKAIVERYLTENHALSEQSARLTVELESRVSEQKHESDTLLLIEAIKASLLPLSDLNQMINQLAVVSKEKSLDVSTINSLITDVSTNVLNLGQLLERNMKDIKSTLLPK